MVNKKVWSKTKIFRTALAFSALLIVAFWIIWLACDTVFLKTGINFDGSKIIPTDIHWYKVSWILASVFLSLSVVFIGAEVSYIVYRSFGWRTDKNKVIYESIIHGAIALLAFISTIISAYMIYNDNWIGTPLYDKSGELYDIDLFHNLFVIAMSLIALASIFSSVSLFQASKAFKLHNVYFDFSLMTAILAVISIPLYIASVCLIKIHPSVPYPAEFWLHISGQGVYSAFQAIKMFMTFFMIACLILLVRLNSEQLQRTKKNIILVSIILVVNIIIDIICRTNTFSALDIYNNKNWISQIVIISISFAVGVIAGWYSCYRYIELYAKPLRRLDKEPMILN